MSSTPRGAFPKSAHLLRRGDFRRVYEQGKRYFSGLMTVFYLPRGEGDAGNCRIGFTVTRAMGDAVERNRIRRRTREAVRHNFSLLAGAGSMDVVINPKKPVLTADFARLSLEIAKAFTAVRQSAEAGAPGVSAERSTRRSSPKTAQAQAERVRKAEGR